MKCITTIPGIGLISATTVIAETNGFALIKNAKQLVNYAGLDVQLRQSGTSVNGKSRISKKGNSHIRKVLYLPALAASRCKGIKHFYERVNTNKPSKKIGVIAVEQKLLKLIYFIWKSEENYNLELALKTSGNDEIQDPLLVDAKQQKENLSETKLAQN